jgi:hypothetical protein
VVVGESIEISKLTCHWLSNPSGRNRIDDGASDRLAGGVEPVPCKAEILDALANLFLKPLLVGNEPHLRGPRFMHLPRSGCTGVAVRSTCHVYTFQEAPSFFRPSRFKKRTPRPPPLINKPPAPHPPFPPHESQKSGGNGPAVRHQLILRTNE